MRIQWDPARSENFETAINTLIEHIRANNLTEIRPQTLRLLKRDHVDKLCCAAFKKHNRPQWAESMFPSTETDSSGFSSFVHWLSNRMENDLENVKAYYITHTSRELGDIQGMSELYHEGEIVICSCFVVC